MKKDRKKIQEPFEPTDTPTPPQIIDPNTGRQREHPVEDAEKSRTTPANKKEGKQEKGHLLSDETEINNETTI